ncbi:FimV family protein [Lysobacter cavernae]|uniref:FimV family protein n=1 Tax=Lysobacter cavernae TaxID=1685901 RepID=A0ABV7RLY6_9GAMM
MVVKHYVRTALAMALALASGTAAALGLGQIEVKSKLGQPLLAEIPIVSSDPGELENVQAELASPLTFARIGLQPPTGIVADLQFASALDATGNPVIRVTSEQPVTDPVLIFLVSVDWGQGRLVREYSALLDAPRTVSAPLQPAIDEAVVAAPNTIERPPESAADPAPADPPGNAEVDAVAQTPDNAVPVAPAPVVVATPARVPAAAIDGDAYSVRRGDTLSEIASRLDAGNGYTLDQTMIALLRANPEAFIGGNINRLKAGAVLQVPAGQELASLDAAQASQIVSQQVQQWRQARRAVPQPATDAGLVAGAAAGEAATAMTSASSHADARLEIVPPGASSATQAGTQSGINAGGEGDMLRQELVQNQETLAAREAELQELKGRIAELEQLQGKQQQLIAMKDSELAAAQQRLAKSNQDQGAAAGAVWPWAIGGGVLLAVLGGWLLRRRPSKPVFRAPMRADAAAAAPVIVEPLAAEAEEVDAPAESFAAFALEAEPIAQPLRPAPITVAPKAPAWHVATADASSRIEPSLATPPGQERLDLARAYLDLGDHDSARQLLSEVVINGDLIARQQASRMLQELE